MDPWLELYWEDMHVRVITALADQLESQLPPDLIARLVEHVYIEEASERVRKIAPDVRVVQSPSDSAIAVAFAQSEVEGDDPIVEHSIEIIDARPAGL
jgi:hypothetical protein